MVSPLFLYDWCAYPRLHRSQLEYYTIRVPHLKQLVDIFVDCVSCHGRGYAGAPPQALPDRTISRENLRFGQKSTANLSSNRMVCRGSGYVDLSYVGALFTAVISILVYLFKFKNMN